ncbi:putative cytidine deaminase [Pseudohyphozyma bogoriensis]|nr:putative cytidine deaminase [Pseudohyphozyma bogoriensis]
MRSMPGGICAERTAIVKGVTPVYLVPAQYSASTPFVSITEAATSGIKDGNYVIHTTLGEILPIPYGPDQYEYRKKLRETGGKAKL